MTHVPTDDELRTMLERLSSQLGSDDLIVLKKDEVFTLREIIKAWMAIKALVHFGGLVKSIAIWFVAIAGAAAAIRAGLLEWLFGGSVPR